MNKSQTIVSVFLLLAAGCFSSSDAEPDTATFPEVQRIRVMLEQPENKMNLSEIKLTIDRMIDRSIDIDAGLKQIDDIAAKIRAIAGKNPSGDDRMRAIRKYLYEKGTWNDYRPYHYDFDDPMGRKIGNKLLPNYMSSRKGNCITMPFMFIILGEKLGIDVTASTAPLHVFVKYTSATGVTVNLETTSGANPARDEWYRQQMPMTDQAVANGLYLRKLTKKETVVVMATVLAEYYARNEEHGKAVAVSAVQLAYYPRYDAAMLRMGSSYYRLLEKHFMHRYPDPNQIPVSERDYFRYLSDNNRYWFAYAESLGWREPGRDYEEKYLNTVKRDAEKSAH